MNTARWAVAFGLSLLFHAVVIFFAAPGYFNRKTDGHGQFHEIDLMKVRSAPDRGASSSLPDNPLPNTEITASYELSADETRYTSFIDLNVHAPGSTDEVRYYSSVRRRIMRYSVYPKQSQTKKEEGRVVIRFALTRKGDVAYSSVTKSSGSAQLDSAALRAVTYAAPFPAMPDCIGQDELFFSIALEYGQDFPI